MNSRRYGTLAIVMIIGLLVIAFGAARLRRIG